MDAMRRVILISEKNWMQKLPIAVDSGRGDVVAGGNRVKGTGKAGAEFEETGSRI